ncbi:MAG: thiamine pyrophosphate-dependent dehydrogenase E1 component subunit alpha [Magnetococcales bacterium]|nr:thiamine pyrophosphate-dependent dehydrogenase E1 component subunit alpha [Magnetococcales bacterium]
MKEKEIQLGLYRKVYLTRRAEDLIRAHYLEDGMKTPMHMSTGGEAISSGICEALQAEDQVLGTYRSHALYLSRTGESDLFFAEMYGKATGMAKGKGGSMHLTAADEGLICTSAIVASNIPVALGAAFANKMAGKESVVAVFFGDGAIDEGVFWESLNAACLMGLRVLFVCEDNGYAVHIPAHKRHGYQSITTIVSGFECDVWQSDSTDAWQIYLLAQQARAAAIQNNRPGFLHLKYYRYLEHVGVFEDFKAGYRSRTEFEPWLERDPVKIQRENLLRWLTEEAVLLLEKQIDQQIETSLQRAMEAPFADHSELLMDLYA